MSTYIGLAAESPRPLTVCAGVAIWDASLLLLIRRAVDPQRGRWSLPGGMLHDGEDPSSGAVREVLEETGLSVAVDRFVGAFVEQDQPIPCVFLLFEGHVLGGVPRPGDDADQVRFFAAGELPPLAFASTRHVAASLSMPTERRI